MAKTKTKTKTRRHKRPLVTTGTRSGGNEFRVTIRRIGVAFRIVAMMRRLPGKGEGRPSPPLIRWACRFNEKEADALVWSLAFELGYEVDEGASAFKDNPLYLFKARDGLFDLEFYRHSDVPGADAGIVISRAGAQKLLEALAKALDWKLTG